MRPVNKQTWPLDVGGSKKKYSPYRSALDDLIDNLGDYCSYCELQNYSISLEVEHVDDKHNNPGKKEDWDNFILACKNCNTIKGTKPIVYASMIFPHLQNTYELFTFLTGGLITINVIHSQVVQNRIQTMINLVGLDRLPGHADYSKKDKRWKYRMKTWDLANRYLLDYKNGDIKVKTIVDLAISNGFWSLWMQVFKKETEVEDALILAFKSTFQHCRETDIDRK